MIEERKKILKKIPVTRIGKIEESKIAGYYVITCLHDPREPDADLLYAIFSGDLKNPSVGQASSLREIVEVCKQRSADENLHVYIIPYQLGENYSAAINRILYTEKFIIPGEYASGKITWLVPRAPLDSQYAVCVSDGAVDLGKLRKQLKDSFCLALVAAYDGFPLVASRQLVCCNFLPEKSGAHSENIQYRNGSGTAVTILKSTLGKKIAKSREIPEFIYDDNVWGPLLFKDFLEKKLKKESVVQGILSSKYSFNQTPDEIPDEIPARVIASRSIIEDRVEIRRMRAIDGFGVFATRDIPQGAFMIYAGEFPAPSSSSEAAADYSFLLSKNSALYAYRRGNFTGLINSATDEKKCNITSKLSMWHGLPVVFLEVTKPISAGMQLLFNYRRRVSEHPTLDFTESVGVVTNDVCKAFTKQVKEEGLSALTSDNPEKAKRKFKQANALMPSNAGTEYYLGVTYCTLAKKSEGKTKQYYGHAQNFFDKTKAHSKTYNVHIEKQLKSIPEQYQLRN